MVGVGVALEGDCRATSVGWWSSRSRGHQGPGWEEEDRTLCGSRSPRRPPRRPSSVYPVAEHPRETRRPRRPCASVSWRRTRIAYSRGDNGRRVEDEDYRRLYHHSSVSRRPEGKRKRTYSPDRISPCAVDRDRRPGTHDGAGWTGTATVGATAIDPGSRRSIPAGPGWRA